jgi:hypothetical protein
MADKKADICSFVQDGATFSTKKEVWIKLARVHAPKEGTAASIRARQLLSDLITNMTIHYEQVGISYNQVIAEVWLGARNINDFMIQSGYGE